MDFKYVITDQNYEKYSAWRVLYGAHGAAPFPVRLIDEIFQRACELLGSAHNLKLYDPCVWSGYMMTIIWLLHWWMIEALDWSDIDEKMIEVAKKNLGLLSVVWMQKRIEELKEYVKLYGKQSHVDTIKDAELLLEWVSKLQHNIQTQCRVQDIDTIKTDTTYDMVITDLPYGNLTSLHWNVDLHEVIEKLWSVLREWGVLVLVSDKKQHFRDFSWQSFRKELSHGKRRITFIVRKSGES